MAEIHVVYAIKYVHGFTLLYFVYHHHPQFLSYWIQRLPLPISFRVASLALGQSYDCPSAREATLKDMDIIDQHPITAEHHKAHILHTYFTLILGMYYIEFTRF